MPEANIEPDARLKGSRSSEGLQGSRAVEGECELVGVRTVGEALDQLL